MSDEYIGREDLPQEVENILFDDYGKGWNDCFKEIKALPAAPVREVVAVLDERRRQIKLFGDQSGTPLFEWMSILGEEVGELCGAVNETCFLNKRHPERGGIDNVYKEATQVAAVAIALMEAIDSGFCPNFGAKKGEAT